MIRQYKAEEIDTLINIWLEGSKISHHFIPASFWEEKAGEMREVYIPTSNTFVYIADDQSQPLGFISMLDNYIAAIFVSPQSQRKGIGSTLIDYVKQAYDQLTLKVYSENKDSIAFYINHGFVITDESMDAATKQYELTMHYNK